MACEPFSCMKNKNSILLLCVCYLNDEAVCEKLKYCKVNSNTK